MRQEIEHTIRESVQNEIRQLMSMQNATSQQQQPIVVAEVVSKNDQTSKNSGAGDVATYRMIREKKRNCFVKNAVAGCGSVLPLPAF